MAVLAVLLCGLASQARAGAPPQKLRVAIKAPVVNEAVGSRKGLDIPKLQSELEAALLSARKFDLVSRRESVMRNIRDEQRFADSSYATHDAAQQGKLQSAHLLLIPAVTGFSFGANALKVPNLASKYLRTDQGHLEMSAQVVDTKTGQIKTTFYMKSAFSTPEELVDQAGGMPSGSHFTDMAKRVGAQMVDQLLELVFPVEIISIQGPQVFINRGQDGGFKNGMLLNAYRKGQELKDPHTGEVLGSAEEMVGTVRVVRVNPKFTVAEAAGPGGVSRMAVGNVVRKPQ